MSLCVDMTRGRALRPLRAVAVMALLGGAAFAAQANDAVPLVQGDKISITTLDIQADALRMPPEMRPLVLSRPQTVGQVAHNLYVRRAMAAEALAQGLDKDPVVAATLKVAMDKVLSDALIERIDQKAAPSQEAAEAKARTLYRANPDRFKADEQVRVRHILISGTTPESKAEAEKILQDLKGGADFAKLATEKSADKGSAEKGGDLGFFARGRMVPSFEQAAFALKNANDMSDLVESQFGYHIIQLLDRKPAGVRPFDEVKDDLVKEVRASIIQDARVAEAQRLQANAKPDAAAIEAFAKRYEAAVPAAQRAVAPRQ
ncbi:MAG: peptidylprolyl isomerase [Burkholderiaceae bacterium]